MLYLVRLQLLETRPERVMRSPFGLPPVSVNVGGSGKTGADL